MKFSILSSSSSKTNKVRGSERSSTSSEHSMRDSSMSTPRTRPEFVSGSMKQMDSHDVARGRGESLKDVLGYVEIPAMVLGIDSDVLYPLDEQREITEYLPNAHLQVIHSDAGHDGFLLEQEQVASHIRRFLDQHD